MTKLNFQQSLLQSSALHGPSEISLICAFGAQETFHIFKQLCCVIILWKPLYIFLGIFDE